MRSGKHLCRQRLDLVDENPAFLRPAHRCGKLRPHRPEHRAFHAAWAISWTRWMNLVEFALADAVDVVVLAGDAYKGRDPSQTHQREFARRLLRLSEGGVLRRFCCRATTTCRRRREGPTRWKYSPRCKCPTCTWERACKRTPSRPGRVRCKSLAVPWPSRGAMLARDESRGLSIEEIRAETERRMTMAIAGRARGDRSGPAPAILAGHVTVNGATVGSERSMMLGNDHVLNVSAVQRPELEYVALGHIHKHQVLRPAGGRMGRRWRIPAACNGWTFPRSRTTRASAWWTSIRRLRRRPDG